MGSTGEEAYRVHGASLRGADEHRAPSPARASIGMPCVSSLVELRR
jgi:hypothetical protein